MKSSCLKNFLLVFIMLFANSSVESSDAAAISYAVLCVLLINNIYL